MGRVANATTVTSDTYVVIITPLCNGVIAMLMLSVLAYVQRVVFRLWVTRFCGTPNPPIIQAPCIRALIWLIIERFGPHMPSVAGKLAGFRATPEIQYTKDCVSEPVTMGVIKVLS